ncbi:uncharacterized protein LOC114721933 [Neltuma alba]|uniref:uncharacterized protein LOC114721933 n=1 Tax=Neltuma alba TaxID=207710 RepID=UPI0010A307BD|nr:uncharacterized protein LOC114721933 [Prosopis alba]
MGTTINHTQEDRREGKERTCAFQQVEGDETWCFERMVAEGNWKKRCDDHGIMQNELQYWVNIFKDTCVDFSSWWKLLSLDDKALVDLVDDSEVDNLFQYNDTSAHVYLALKESTPEVMDDPQIIDNYLGLSQQMCFLSSRENNMDGTVCDENGGDCVREGGGGCHVRLVSTVEIAPTPMPEMNAVKWKELLLGKKQTFANATEFRKAVYKFSIAENFEYKYVKNCEECVHVKCKVEGCPWRIIARVAAKRSPFLVVTRLSNEHVHNAQEMMQVTHGGRAALTSSIIIEEVRDHTEKRPNEIRRTLARDYGVKLTYKQAYRAKEKALEEIQGRPEQSYMLIPWICQRLKETDEKTVAEWVATVNNIFERVFIAYGCCIEGFLSGARHILYIDGTHLSGPYRGTLLSASAYDADNELLPFAYAIVKGETYEEWAWFLNMIKQIVGAIQLIIVSDRHNAIIGAVGAIFGGDRHAYCYRHVKENFSSEMNKLYRGRRRTSGISKEVGLKLLDDIAYARVNVEFDKAMTRMGNFSPQLLQWLNNHGDIHKWAMSKFAYKRWDNITTNIAESFNAWIVKERQHNVAQLIHEHREKVARKMFAASVAMRNWRNGVGPNIDGKVMENVARSIHMHGEPYGGGRVCVHTSRGALYVNVQSHECTCAAWQMTGIPCPHACAAIRVVHANVYDFCGGLL